MQSGADLNRRLLGCGVWESRDRRLNRPKHSHSAQRIDKPALCSLASRIPYGEPLSFNKVNKVNEAEKFILDLDINNVRVRYHDNIARIEVDETDIVTIIQHKDQISLRLKELGFDYVTIDLEGYRTGSMNEVIQS